jgi:hypothetical protein
MKASMRSCRILLKLGQQVEVVRDNEAFEPDALHLHDFLGELPIAASFPFGVSSVPYPDEARAKTQKKHQARFGQTRR